MDGAHDEVFLERLRSVEQRVEAEQAPEGVPQQCPMVRTNRKTLLDLRDHFIHDARKQLLCSADGKEHRHLLAACQEQDL